MSDPYRKLTAAVVEIGTQLRRIADAHTTDVAANPAATFAAVDVQAALNNQRRADTAEQRLARIRDMADNWECRLPATIRTATAAEAVRNAANGDDRPVMFAVTPAPADDDQAVQQPTAGTREFAERERARMERLYTRETVRAQQFEDRSAKYEHVAKELKAELEQARKDVAFSDEAARRASQLRQDMATERYALQEQCDQLAAAVYRAELAIEDYRGSLSHALGLGTSAPWDAIHARAAELHRDNGQLLGEQAACIEAERRRDELAATLHDVLRHFTQKGHPGEPCLQTGWIAEKTVARWRAVLNPPATKEQPPEDTAQCWRKEPHVPHTWTLSPEEGGVDCPGVDQPAVKEQPDPDFTSPLTGIEVRDPCPHCGDQQMVSRSQFTKHVARLHPEERQPDAR